MQQKAKHDHEEGGVLRVPYASSVNERQSTLLHAAPILTHDGWLPGAPGVLGASARVIISQLGMANNARSRST